ncbi:MAG: hypothetical protein KBD31_06090 [Proteobacteria bacterium]|nr:hypothetical protein [Pseudomonadota bacterium]
MNKFLNVIFPKIFATFVISILGHTAFTSVPLWAGIFLVIPGFSLFLLFFLKGDVQFVHNNGPHRSSQQNYRTQHQRNFSQISTSRYGVNCTSLTDRKNKFGY